jgi:hypothetical protein
MRDMELEDDLLRQKKQYAGGYVAWLDGKVILSAETCDELSDRLDELPREVEARAVIEYIPPADAVYVPWYRIVEGPSNPV